MHVLELFTSDHCPGCPAARTALQRLCEEDDSLRLVIVDVDSQPAKAGVYGLVATPATVINGRHVLYGVPRPDVIRRYVASIRPIDSRGRQRSSAASARIETRVRRRERR